MKKTKNEKGITLVALIITIVVLLILAMVTIGAVQDSNIISHAQNSTEEYTVKKEEEEGKLSEYETEIEKYIPKENKAKVFNFDFLQEGIIGILSPDSSKLAYTMDNVLMAVIFAEEKDIPTIESMTGMEFGVDFIITDNVKFKKLLYSEGMGIFALSEDEEKIYWHGPDSYTIDGSICGEINNSIDASQYYNDSSNVEYYNYILSDPSGIHEVDYSNEKINVYTSSGTKYDSFTITEATTNDTSINVTVGGQPVTISTNAKKIGYKVDENRNVEYMYAENGILYFRISKADETESGVVEGIQVNTAELTNFINKTQLASE